MSRERLPTRRPQIVLEVQHAGNVFTVGLGYFPDARLSTARRAMGRLGDKQAPASLIGAILDAVAAK